jgi:hypothetical protein
MLKTINNKTHLIKIMNMQTIIKTINILVKKNRIKYKTIFKIKIITKLIFNRIKLSKI